MAKRIIIWLGIYAVWLLSTRQYHPTLLIAIIATAILISISALGVYSNKHLLRNRLSQRRSWGTYGIQLIISIAALDLIAVISIQTIYDRLWGPDPNRFGFWFNMASDGFIIMLHIVAAQGITWIAERLSNRRLPDI
ncbi:MAG: hypothetical protein RBJ76_14875 [Stenomitos frigidus ULC029]